MSIVCYSSSDDDDNYDEANDSEKPSLNGKSGVSALIPDSKNYKRKAEWDEKKNAAISKKHAVEMLDGSQNSTGGGRLPLPADIRTMFSERGEGLRGEEWVDDPQDHQGRVRSFKHERGNWASSVYIPLAEDNDIDDLIEDILKTLSQHKMKFTRCDDLHLSLSRTFVMRHHWIEPLVQELNVSLTCCTSGMAYLGDLELYVNDEGTRTFLALRVTSNTGLLVSYVKAVDVSLNQYKLPLYYQNPSFHISLAWALGDLKSNIEKSDLIKVLKAMVKKYFSQNPSEASFPLTDVLLKTGNKQYSFRLRNSF